MNTATATPNTNAPALKATIPYDASSAIVFGHRAERMLTSAGELVIDSASMRTAAAEDLQSVKALQKTVEDTRKTIAEPLFRAKQAVDALFKAPADYLLRAESQLKKSILRYDAEVERKVAEARRIAAAEERKERERLAAIEQQQQAAAREAEKKAQHLADESAAAAAAGDTAKAADLQQQAQQQAAAAETAQATADATAQEAAVTTVTPLFTAPAAFSGISSRTTYSAQVDDLLELVKAVADGKAPLEALAANTVFLGQQARAFKKAGPLYPGVSCVAERGIAARAA